MNPFDPSAKDRVPLLCSTFSRSSLSRIDAPVIVGAKTKRFEAETEKVPSMDVETSRGGEEEEEEEEEVDIVVFRISDLADSPFAI